MPSIKEPRRRRLPLIALLTAACLAATAGPASAYSGSGAASYADAWATSNNYPTYPYFNADCTNFVSQAVHACGYPFRNAAGTGTDSWWIIRSGPTKDTGYVWGYSGSWVNVVDSTNFLIADNPGGFPEGSAPGSSTNGYHAPISVVTGDVTFL